MTIKTLAKNQVQTGFDLEHSEESPNCIPPSGQVFLLATPKKGQKCPESNKIISENKRSLSPSLGKNQFRITLPGHGYVKDEMCGEFKLALQCPSECEEPKKIFHNCGRITCPVCYENALSHMSSRSADRLENVVASYRLNGINVGDLKHGVYSPPPGKYKESDFDDFEGLDRLRNEAISAYDFLKNGDYTGCFPIIHPWRQCHTDGSTCDDYNCKRHHLWYFSPHVHMIYVGFLKESTQLYHSKKFNGSIWKRISDGGKKRDILATIQYQLSHSAIPFKNEPKELPLADFLFKDHPDWFSLRESKPVEYVSKVPGQIIRYYGIFANCKAGKSIIATQDRLVVCPKCGSEIRKYDRIDLDNKVVRSTCHDEPFFLKVNINQWRIRINGNILLGVRSAEVDDQPYGFFLSTTERQRMESSVDLNPSLSNEEVQIIHYKRDPSTDSNWSEFNYYEY